MDQPGPAAPSPARLLGRWLRRVAAVLVVGVVVLVAAGAALWLFRVPAATWLIARAAESAGLGPARLTIDRLDLSGLIVRDLRLGDGDPVTVAEVTASYTLEQLRQLSIDTLRLRGVRLQVAVDEQAIRIGGFVRPLGQRRGSPALPLRSLELERFEVVAEAASSAAAASPPSARRGTYGLATAARSPVIWRCRSPAASGRSAARVGSPALGRSTAGSASRPYLNSGLRKYWCFQMVIRRPAVLSTTGRGWRPGGVRAPEFRRCLGAARCRRHGRPARHHR